MSKARDIADSYTNTEVETYSDNNSIGVNQTRQDVSASRSAGVTYTNTTGKPIGIIIRSNYGINVDFVVFIDGVSRNIVGSPSVNQFICAEFIVPNNSTYYITIGSGTIGGWHELR